jgi:uncharacterized OB-fold protein
MTHASAEAAVAASAVPLVDYLVLGEHPHLVANECAACGARYFDRRNACAKCFGREFGKVDIASDGTVVTYTIVAFAAPGIAVPYVSAIVECEGTRVQRHPVRSRGTSSAVRRSERAPASEPSARARAVHSVAGRCWRAESARGEA